MQGAGLMGAWLPVVCLWWATGASVDTGLIEVAPPRNGLDWKRTPGHERAVVLIHGLHPHPFSKNNVVRAALHSWQRPDAGLVQQLSKDSDVYSFIYGQNASVDAMVERTGLLQYVQRLQHWGYRDIVLVGHSAGGLIARQLVEDHPDAGVTKVIQISTPNRGSSWANLQTVRSCQQIFLESLTKPVRQQVAAARAGKTIPPQVEFACIVGTGGIGGDGMVLTASQWPAELQRQNVPVYPVNATHWFTVRTQRAAELISTLVREPQPRWAPSRVQAYRRHLIGD
jgi:pimeloyl-ACP methyl ester carboxylesterase